jgi:hypothetical protein
LGVGGTSQGKESNRVLMGIHKKKKKKRYQKRRGKDQGLVNSKGTLMKERV